MHTKMNKTHFERNTMKKKCIKHLQRIIMVNCNMVESDDLNSD